jgi:hypothetical protein
MDGTEMAPQSPLLVCGIDERQYRRVEGLRGQGHIEDSNNAHLRHRTAWRHAAGRIVPYEPSAKPWQTARTIL